MRFNRKNKKGGKVSPSDLDIKKKAKEDIEFLFAQIDSIDINEIKNEEVHLRLGNQVFKLVNVGDVDESYIEDKIREEYRTRLSEKLETIKRKINTKLNQMSEFVTQIKEDYDHRENKLKAQIANAVSMPEVNYDHAKNGLSVVRGKSPKELVWLVQGVYWPKYLNQQALEPEFSAKMITPITIQVKTTGDKIVDVSVRKPIGLGRFKHYHSHNSSECWGQWKYSRNWKEANDIIKIAAEAQAVLETINKHSPGTENPRGLPRLNTVKKHVLRGEKVPEAKIKRKEERVGITPQETHLNSANIWST